MGWLLICSFGIRLYAGACLGGSCLVCFALVARLVLECFIVACGFGFGSGFGWFGGC